MLRRIIIYTLGMMTLAFGISLNTQTHLGVSPLISMPFSLSLIKGWNFAFLTFIMYVIFTLIELALEGSKRNYWDLLQIPFSLAFSLLLQFYDDGYAAVTSFLGMSPDSLWQRLILLVFAIMLTGIGISMTVNMKLIPNPADGLAREVANKIRRPLGTGKNVIDIISVSITCTLGLVLTHSVVGVGLGTVAAMILTGRAVALFNHFALIKMLRFTGMYHRE